MTRPYVRHLVFAVVVMSILAAIRLGASGPTDLDHLSSFETSAGLDVGPDSAFFASGLNGDAAVFTLMALDPLGQDVGRLLTNPSYRYLRPGYPLVAAALSLGRDDLVLVGLFTVSLLSAGATAFLASKLSESQGVKAWALVLNPALTAGVLWSTSEPLALAVLAFAIFSGSAILGWSVSLVRPSYLLALASRWRVLLAGAATVFLAKLFWSRFFGEAFLGISGVIDWPFVGVLESPSLMGWAVVLSGLTTAAVGILRRDATWIVSGAFVWCFGTVVLDTPVNAVRAAGFLPVLWAFGPGFEPRGSLSNLISGQLRPSGDVAGGSYPER